MIIEKIMGNIHDLQTSEINRRHVEKVFLDSDHLVKRIQRVMTDHGNEIGIRLKEPRDLVPGDILHMDDENIVVVDVKTDDLIVVRPKDLHEMGVIAHQLGNRHTPAQFEGKEMLVQYDYLIEELLKKLEISYHREKRKVKQAFRHIGHSHD